MRKIFNILFLICTLMSSVNTICLSNGTANGEGFIVTISNSGDQTVSYNSSEERFEITGIGWGQSGTITITNANLIQTTELVGSEITWNNWGQNSSLNLTANSNNAIGTIQGNLNKTIYLYLKYNSGTLYYSSSRIGPQKPIIGDIDFNGCIENLQSLSAPSVTYAGTNSSGHWELNSTPVSLNDITINDVGKNLTYVATDDNGTTTSPAIELKAAPTVSNLSSNLLYCSENGAYDLSQHIVSDNGLTATTQWYFKSANDNDFRECNSNPASLAQGDELKVVSSNSCGSFEQAMTVDFGCKPIVNTVAAPASICDNTQVSLEIPEIEYFDETIDTREWQIFLNGNWQTFNTNQNLSRATHDNARVRLRVENSIGETFSNEVRLSVLAATPEYTVSKDASSVFQSYGNESSSVTYTVTKVNACNNDEIEFDITDKINFDYSINGNEITISLKDNRALGDYETDVLFDVGGIHKEETLEGSVKNYPKCYEVDRLVSGIYYDTYTLCTDMYGNINIDLNNGDNPLTYIQYDAEFCDTCQKNSFQYENGNWRECYRYVSLYPKEDIACQDFIFNGHVKGGQEIYPLFVNTKQIVCDSFYVNTTQSRNYFLTTCSSTIYANKSVTLQHSYKPIELKGNVIAPNVFISDGNNTSISIDECAFLRSEHLELEQSAQNAVIINGHVVSDEIVSSSDIILAYDGDITNPAIITVGEIASSITIVCGKNTTVNLCKNPILTNPDKLGIFLGDILYNTNSENGWENLKPSQEGDINFSALTGFDNSYLDTKWKGIWETKYGITQSDIADAVEIPAYSTYEKCMEERPDIEILGIDDDPFIPKDKEIKFNKTYCDPCDKELEHTKMQIRELGNKWFRYINGELIYCEGDN